MHIVLAVAFFYSDKWQVSGGGMPSYVIKIAKLLKDRDHSVQIVAGASDDRVWEYQLMKDPYTHEYLKKHGVELISYRELIEMKRKRVKKASY